VDLLSSLSKQRDLLWQPEGRVIGKGSMGTMSRTGPFFAWAALALAAAACAPQNQPTSAERETTISATAVVESIDMETRQVGLRAADGELIEVVAGPEVRNLPQLRVGDEVRFDYYESVAAEMAEPEDPGQPLGAVVTDRAPEGALPGGLVATATSQVVEVVSYDPATARAVVRLHDGTTRSFDVHPEMQAFAAARRPGERVLVTTTEALAISIEPRAEGGRTGMEGR
jgi:hypothetical protein